MTIALFLLLACASVALVASLIGLAAEMEAKRRPSPHLFVVTGILAALSAICWAYRA